MIFIKKFCIARSFESDLKYISEIVLKVRPYQRLENHWCFEPKWISCNLLLCHWLWISSPDNVKYTYECGHDIANHTITHPYLTKLFATEIRNEYDQAAAKLKGIIGAEPSKLLRPPFLDYNDSVQQTLHEVPFITCDIDTEDWNKASKDQIIIFIFIYFNKPFFFGLMYFTFIFYILINIEK